MSQSVKICSKLIHFTKDTGFDGTEFDGTIHSSNRWPLDTYLSTIDVFHRLLSEEEIHVFTVCQRPYEVRRCKKNVE